jgi:hypothetical protein
MIDDIMPFANKKSFCRCLSLGKSCVYVAEYVEVRTLYVTEYAVFIPIFHLSNFSDQSLFLRGNEMDTLIQSDLSHMTST